MGEWKEYQLDDLYDFSSGLSKPADQFGFGYPFLSFKEVFQNYFLPRQLTQLVNSTEKERDSGSIKRGDVFITRTSETDDDLGMTSVARQDYPDATFNGFTKRMRPKDCVDIWPEYAGYYFRSKRFQAEIAVMSSVTTRASLNNGMLASLKMKLPPIEEQRAIADVLSSLDDKIDLLHRQNKTLESLAQTLFRHWFIDQANDDWEVKKVDDVVSVKGGTTPSTKNPEFWDGDIAWTAPKDLSNHSSVFLMKTERTITEEGLAQIGSGLLPVGTVLLSSRAPIGYLAITEIPVAINQGYIAIIADKGISKNFIYLWAKTNVEAFKNAGNGSVFQEISKSVFRNLDFALPPSKLLTAFDEQIDPIFEKIKANAFQLGSLQIIREKLLPKLMGGEIRLAN